jgi:hypothetical protein
MIGIKCPLIIKSVVFFFIGTIGQKTRYGFPHLLLTLQREDLGATKIQVFVEFKTV